MCWLDAEYVGTCKICYYYTTIITNVAAVASCQKTAIFPETREGNIHSSNESAQAWLLREANI